MRVTHYRATLFICLFLGLISKGPCIAKPETEAAEDDANDDYEYYDDEDDAAENVADTIQVPSTYEPPYFDDAVIEVTASPNSDVLLPCNVKNFHVNNVVMWYKGDKENIFVNGQYSPNSRVEGLKNNSMLLKNAQTDDEGDYYCEVLPQKVRQQVTLKIAKAFTILCDGIDVLDRSIVYRQGESHVCECQIPGSDISNIRWYLNSKHAELIVKDIKRNKIHLNNIDDQFSGVYQCIDYDGGVKPKHGLFNLRVMTLPKINTHRHHVNAELSGNAELYCDYKADPIAVTHWLRHGNSLSYSEKHMITYSTEENRFNRTTLRIKDVALNDLGEYICQAENSLGAAELKIHLMLEPERGQFENIKIEGRKVTLYWLVRSLQPLSEAILDYRISGSYTWSTTSFLHTQRHESGIWKITHEMELTPGEWQTRMKTKNTVGWSKFSIPYIFTIDEEDDYEDSEDVGGFDDDGGRGVMIAGFGGGERNSNSSRRSAASESQRASQYFTFILLFIVVLIEYNL